MPTTDELHRAGLDPRGQPSRALLSLLRGATEYLEIIGAVIAITLGYLSVSRERANRTLPLIRSRPVTPGELAAGTTLGAVGLIGTPELAALRDVDLTTDRILGATP